jgi:hypothetical protein
MHMRHISNVHPRALRVARIVERWNATAAFSLSKTRKPGGGRCKQNLQLSGIFPVVNSKQTTNTSSVRPAQHGEE